MHHLLPFIEEEPLYDQLKPQMDALIPNSFGMVRAEGRNTVVNELVCPSNPGDTAACAYWGAMDYRGAYYNPLSGGALFTTLNPPNSLVPDYLWEACANYPVGSAQPRTPCGGSTDRNRNNVGGRGPERVQRIGTSASPPSAGSS